MAEVDAFGKVLYETISANKLSSSRVDRVKSYAVRCFHESSLLVKMIIKCHKKASKSTKVSSLYLFDAVARHASEAVRKHGQGFDASGARAPKKDNSIEPGTAEALVAGAKAFLSTAQRAAQELCLDTLATVPQEQKEKVKKVVDIWGKANTFEAGFLSKLQASLATATPASDERNSAERSTTPTGEPQPAEAGPSSKPVEPPAGANSILETLSGVLQGLRSNNAAAAPVPPPPSQPSFDLSQLSALQHLAAASTAPPPQVPSAPFSSIPPFRPPPSIPPVANPSSQQYQSPPVTWDPPRSQGLTRSPNSSYGREPKRSRFSVDESSNGPPAAPAAPAVPAVPALPVVPAAPSKDEANLLGPDTGHTLADFDMSTFDPTQPSAWQKLAGMWKNTYGYVPSNQELMMCMMMGAFPPMPGASTAPNAPKHASNGNQGTSNDYGQQQHGRNGTQERRPSESYPISR